MPKKALSLKEFGGGVSNLGSGRDLEDNQSYVIVNMNPNSENGSISMSGDGKSTYEIDSTGDGAGDTPAQATTSTDTYFTIKPGYGLFRFNSDYGNFSGIADIESQLTSPYHNQEESAETTEAATEYILISSRVHTTDNYQGMFVNLLENKLDGSNSNTANENIFSNKFQLTKKVQSATHNPIPSFFYAAGGIRMVNGGDTETDPSPYVIARRVRTDFGLHKERTKDLDTNAWETGDSPFVDHWVVNELRTTIEDAWEWTKDEEVADTGRLAQPKESFAHCVETLSDVAIDESLTGLMNDGEFMFMINNHIDNNGDFMQSIPHAHQLRSCSGKDAIKVQMVMTKSPGTADAGAWSFNFAQDEFYVTYYHDNGTESRLTRVRPWYAGWINGSMTLPDGSVDNTAFDTAGKLDNIRWMPQKFTNGVLDRDPGAFDENDFKFLGGGQSITNGNIDGLGVKFQCMIGNETIGNDQADYSNYAGSENSMDGELSSDGLIQGKSIKGMRMYLKSQRSFNSDNVYLLCEIDFEKGIRLNGSPQYNNWNFKKSKRSNEFNIATENTMDTEYYSDIELSDAGGRSKWMFCESTTSILPVPVETYKILNQVAWDDLVVPSFKTAVVLNSRTYIGNVRVRGTTYPDRMMKSVVSKYDTYSMKSFIDVVVQDADEIIHLATIGDKLLQFKRRVLHIINCQEDFEVLESSYKFAGVSNPSQVASTDFGVIWANSNGLFFYNGSKMQNLLDREGVSMLDQASWGDIVTDASDSQVAVGYNPKTKDIIIMRQGSDKSGFVYNLYKKNIVKLEEKFVNTNKTNFINAYDGTLVYASQGDEVLKKWDSSPKAEDTYTGTILQTKDITFVEPSVRKTISSIYITYKSNGDTNVDIDAILKKIGGNEETINHIGGTSGYSLPTTSNKWRTERISTYYTGSAEASLRTKFKNITSISLIFKAAGTVPSTFIIDDISFSYRQKGIR